MKAQFNVTVEGKWFENGEPITASMVERALRKAVKEEFEYLAKRVTVKNDKVRKEQK